MSKIHPEYKTFLMSFFENEEGYEERKVNTHWLIKHWDGNAEKWVVDLYPEQSYINYKRARADFEEQQQRMDFLKGVMNDTMGK